MSLSFELGSTPTEKYQLGEVVGVNEVKAADFGIPIELKPKAIYSVEIRDPYVECFTLEEQAEVRNQEQEINDFARDRRLKGYWERKVGTAYVDESDVIQEAKQQWGDPVSYQKFFDQMIKSLPGAAWQSKIPSASSLADLSDPLSLITIADNKGQYYPIDYITQQWLSLCTDAVSIRNRSSIMSSIVQDFVKNSRTNHEKLNWLSVACGTALPVIKASLALDIDPNLMLVDIDSRAMSETRKLAAEMGFKGTIDFTKRLNIFSKERMERLKKELDEGNKLPTLLDLMGIFEYTGENLGINPATFLRSNYDLLENNGILIFGQMRDDRPLQDFTMGVIGWPYIHMRSPIDFMKIINEAKIPTDNTTIFLPNDGVYMVGVIQKTN